MHPDITNLVSKVLSDQQLDFQQKKEMLNELRKLQAPESNRWNFRFVIWTLSALSISIPFIVVVSLFKEKAFDIPDSLLSLGSAAVGALATFLSPFAQKREATPTRSAVPISPKP